MFNFVCLREISVYIMGIFANPINRDYNCYGAK